MFEALLARVFRRDARREPDNIEIDAAFSRYVTSPRAEEALEEARARASVGEIASAIALCRQVLSQHENHQAARLRLAQLELPGDLYLDLLARLHRHLRPASYLEIGVFQGDSLRLPLPDTQVIGVDPAPQIDGAKLAENTQIYKLTSDEFFAQPDVRAVFDGKAIEMAFIDGMHLFDAALRDFSNIERLATPDSTILIHDCYPQDRITAQRERVTAFWSGDVWRLILVLRKYRPDLKVYTIGCWPTGLGLVRNLDPQSRILSDQYDEIVAEFMACEYSQIEHDKARMLNLVPNDWERISALFD